MRKTFTKIQFTFSASLDYILHDLREELFYANLSIHRKSLQHWDTSIVGWVVFFDPCGDATILTEHPVHTVKTIVKFEPIFAFKWRKIYNDSTGKSTAKNNYQKEKEPRPEICAPESVKHAKRSDFLGNKRNLPLQLMARVMWCSLQTNALSRLWSL